MAPLTDLNKTASDDAQVVQVEDSSSGNTLGITASNAAKIDGSAVTQPISAAALPLPTGASTSALQTAANASLVSIDAALPATLGQTTMANSLAIVIASDQTTLTVQGPSGVAGTPSGGILTVQGTNLGAPMASAMIDTSNSTATPLTAGSTFTGAWKDVTSFSNLTLIVFADQVSATDGLVFEFSTDGTNVDDNDMYTVPASSGQQISIPLVAKYVRIRYVNGGVNQGAFRLQSKLHNAYPKGSSQRVGTPINNEQDAELTLAVIARQSLSASSPTATSVGITSASAVASNANRKGLTLVNTSIARISLGIGTAAVLNSGITIYPGGSWEMDLFNFTTAAVNAIASVAASNLAIQEFT